ncbi:hypothetical protein HYH02_014600 [Chlamydomonas schloesseri]|uniref:Uncharacterized protein n=1 Tax=Chlamydomonas schloesseri TaxID=2026947 RepID=A0A835SV71_9CHLO|nr:hypothetical protein HYH02_014600 [Chlamydomonas schloesseri]|eukprot:KAG2427380.1 hypothetical protein HYH02_014600 [Chlamydomonas schloesseri]
MAGHSATLFLDTVPTATLLEFDLGDMPWSQQNAQMLREAYGSRFMYIKGDSAQTIPAVAANSTTKCDVIFVDGAKGERMRRQDVLNFMQLAHKEAYVFGDEANTVECMSGAVGREDLKCLEGPHGDTVYAWNSLVRDGTLKYIGCSRPVHIPDIVCLWQFKSFR